MLVEFAGSVSACSVLFRQKFPDSGEAPVGEPCHEMNTGESYEKTEQSVQGGGRKSQPDGPERLHPSIDMPLPIDGVHLVHECIQCDAVGGGVELRGTDIHGLEATSVFLPKVGGHLRRTDRAGTIEKDLQWISRCVGHSSLSAPGQASWMWCIGVNPLYHALIQFTGLR